MQHSLLEPWKLFFLIQLFEHVGGDETHMNLLVRRKTRSFIRRAFTGVKMKEKYEVKVGSVI